MSPSIGTTMVGEVVNRNIFTVNPTDKIESVAKLFGEHDVNAAPVVDGLEKCIGIITSYDLVEYEAVRRDMESEFQHGFAFDLARYGDGESYGISGQAFDEVAYHMSTSLESIELSAPLSRAARIMCQKHIHHLVVLSEHDRLVGILSTLDILGNILGEPIVRRSSKSDASP